MNPSSNYLELAGCPFMNSFSANPMNSLWWPRNQPGELPSAGPASPEVIPTCPPTPRRVEVETGAQQDGSAGEEGRKKVQLSPESPRVKSEASDVLALLLILLNTSRLEGGGGDRGHPRRC